MKLKTEGINSHAYGNDYTGFEFVLIEKKDEKKQVLLFENRLAIQGLWLSTQNVEKMIEIYEGIVFRENKKPLIEVGDRIIINSYKERSNVYDKIGNLSGTPDVNSSYEVIE